MDSFKAVNTVQPSYKIYFTIPYIILILLSLKTFYFRYVAFACVLMFICIFLLGRSEIFIKRKYLYLIWFVIGYSFLGLIYGGPIQIIKNISMVILVLAPFFIFDWTFSPVRKNNREQNSKLLIKVMTPVLIYNVIATLYYLFRNPYIARYMANFDSSRGIDRSMGIIVDLPIAIGGGYVLIYGIILLPVVLLYLAKNIYSKLLTKISYITIAAFLLYFVIKSGFATAFILSTAGIIFVILSAKNQKIINNILIVSLIIVVSIVLMNTQLLSDIINIITSVLPQDSIISVRLNEIVPALYGTSSNISSFSMRLNGLETTLNAFLENPILGVGYKVGFDYIAVSSFIGLHTEWIDLLAQYGLFLGLPLLLFIGLSFKDLLNIFKGTQMETIIKTVVFMIIVLGFLNPILTTSVFVIAMVYIPCLLTLYSKTEFKPEVHQNEDFNNHIR